MVTFTATTTGDEVVKAFPTQVRGKTVLITGPSEGGLGAQTAIFLAAGKPKSIILAGRNESKIQPVIDQLKKSDPDVSTIFLKLDLADQSSIRKAAKEVNSQVDKLDILINNAGVMALKDYTTTADGIEMQLGANHIGHFLFTNLVMDKIFAAGKGARIVNVSSLGYMSGGVHFDDYNFKNGESYNPWIAYSQSKTANILFTSSLADKLKSKGVVALVVNPGLVLESKLMVNVTSDMFAQGHAIATESLKGAPMPDMAPKSLAAGCSTILYGALDPSLIDHPAAFLNDGTIFPEPLREHATGEQNKEKLWALSEKLVGEEFKYV